MSKEYQPEDLIVFGYMNGSPALRSLVAPGVSSAFPELAVDLETGAWTAGNAFVPGSLIIRDIGDDQCMPRNTRFGVIGVYDRSDDHLNRILSVVFRTLDAQYDSWD